MYKQLGPQGWQWLNPASDWSARLLNVSILSLLLSEGRQKLKGTIWPKLDGSRGKHSGAEQTLATWLAPAGEFLDLQTGWGRRSTVLCSVLLSSPRTVQDELGDCTAPNSMGAEGTGKLARASPGSLSSWMREGCEYCPPTTLRRSSAICPGTGKNPQLTDPGNGCVITDVQSIFLTFLQNLHWPQTGVRKGPKSQSCH